MKKKHELLIKLINLIAKDIKRLQVYVPETMLRCRYEFPQIRHRDVVSL